MVVISICALNCRTYQYKGLCVKPDIHSSVNKKWKKQKPSVSVMECHGV